MKQVKGPWLKDYVKMIRRFLKANPEKIKEFENLLERKDWDIINSFVVPMEFYDYDSFQRIGRAVFIVIAQSNLEATQAFGGLMIEELLQFYKRVLVEGNPTESLQRFITFHTDYFKSVASHSEMLSFTEKSAVIKLDLVESDKNYPEAAQAFAYQLGGSFEKLAAKAGGNNLKIEIKEDNEKNYLYIINWQ